MNKMYVTLWIVLTTIVSICFGAFVFAEVTVKNENTPLSDEPVDDESDTEEPTDEDDGISGYATAPIIRKQQSGTTSVCNWVLTTDGVLTISGNGGTADYLETGQKKNIAPWSTYFDSINSVVVEEGVTYLGNYILAKESNVQSITLPTTLTSLGVGVFAYDYSLESIEIPSGVTTIPNSCFKQCTALSDIVIGDSVTTISDNAYEGTVIESYVVPSSVTTLGTSVFKDCSSLVEITISATVIGDYTFDGCTSLRKCTFGEGTTTISATAFSQCDALSELILPTTITNIAGLSGITFYESDRVTPIDKSVVSNVAGKYFYGNSTMMYEVVALIITNTPFDGGRYL